ncbi:MAG: pyridoxal phosphate-dependent aminotransferase [Phycisphaerae bacterium]|nr:pyridoxal phosphate-dependent aminotransferase [Phycisphaerae bacterium]
MSISKKLQEQMQRSSWIRRMFEEAERLKKERGEDAVLDLSLGNPIEEPPVAFLDSLKAASVESLPGTHRYMNNAGYPETRAKVAELVSREQGVPLTEANILMSCGAAGGLNVVLKSLLDPGDEVIIFAPFFAEYIFYADNHNGVAKIVESDENFQPDADRLEEAVTEKTKAVIINNPNNPTGVVYPPTAIRQLADILSQKALRFGHPIYLISDEVYRHIVYDDVALPSVLREYADSIIVTSCSKDLGLAGERIGYIAISPNLEGAGELFAACTTTTRTLGFVNAPAMMQRSIRACLDARVDLGLYRRNREVLCDALVQAGFRVVKPSGAFYIFPQSPEPDDVAYCSLLREKGVIVVPGSGFGRGGHIRLSYSVEHQTAVKAAAILAELR